MSLDIDNKIYRNIQEQVAHNASNIQKIADYIDGLDVEDHLIVLTSESGTLSAEQFRVASQDTAYIKYNGNIYIKAFSNASDIDFYLPSIAWSAIAGGGLRITKSGIRVRVANGNYGTFIDIYDTYSKSEIDSLLSDKVSIETLNSSLAPKANLSGAAFTGEISAPNIVEIMPGYSFVKNNDLQQNGITLDYIGVAKTGNKLTLSISGEVIPNDNMASNPEIGYFVIPTPVRNKLVANSLGYLDNKAIYYLSNATQVGTLLPVVMRPSLAIQLFQVKSQLTAGTTYVFRYEVTYLLGDNLAV